MIFRDNKENSRCETPWLVMGMGVLLLFAGCAHQSQRVEPRVYEAKDLRDPAKVAKYLADDPTLIRERFADGMKFIHVAAMYGDSEVVCLLLNHGADVNAKYGCFGMTALSEAASNGHEETVRILVDHGAKVNVKDTTGWTALHYALWRGHLNVGKLLVSRGAKLDVYTAAGIGDVEALGKCLVGRYDLFASRQDPVLHWAARNGQCKVVAFLLDRNVDVNSKDFCGQGNTALHYAVMGEHLELVKLLIGRSADVNATGVYHQTPLITAATYGRKEIAKLLLDHKADFGIRDGYGLTALKTAIEERQPDIADLLRSYGAKE